MFKNKKTYLIPIVGFAIIIVISAMLLCLPICNKTGVSFKDALFVATSGLTTTGFTKAPIMAEYTFWGLLILTILMEIGGLGFIIFISFFESIRNKKMKMSDIIVINDSISSENYGSVKKHSIFLFKLMIKIQVFGIILLSLFFVPQYGFLKGICYSTFLCISAFSNTGFDLFSGNSLYSYRENIFIQLVLSLIMLLGSVGIFLIEDIENNKTHKFNRLKLQSKLVIIYSIILIFIPTFIMMKTEKNVSFINGFFMSISARSTGFSTVDLKNFSMGNKVLYIILMIIGGAPASTSGGIKIMTLAIVLATVISTIRGEENTVIFWKKISNNFVRKAFTILTIFLVAIFTFSTILYNTNTIHALNSVFEVTSAITNTGLSITDLNELTIYGQFLLMFIMFLGRVGPLTMVMVFVNENSKDKFVEYPTENIIL